MDTNQTLKPKLSPKDFFLHIAAMAALYISAISLLSLLFEYINVLFPDQLQSYRDPYSGGIRFAIASLIIIYPAYVFLTRILNQELRLDPTKRELGIRKWLIFLTLFVAGITIIIDLIVLVNTFLGGELTTRFVLKVTAVLAVIGGAFWYYLEALKDRWEHDEVLLKKIGWGVSAVVLASIIAGFFIMGSPQSQRELRFDNQRVSDLQSIQWQIVNYWQQKGVLPGNLSALEDSISGYTVPTDPQTGEIYSYGKLSGLAFELCAQFDLASAGSDRVAPQPKMVEPLGFKGANWQHKAGTFCFERTIDPDLYPARIRI